MDIICALRALLHPLIEPTIFVFDDIQPLTGWSRRRFGLLEYRATLDDGRTVVLGLYQFSAWRTVTAEMWIPDDARRMDPQASIESVALHRQVWSYTLLTDGDMLARTIATEVGAWLCSFDPTADLNVEEPAAGTETRPPTSAPDGAADGR
jgi:hypothetical protein